LLFACFQRALAEELYRPVVGGAVWDWITSGTVAPMTTLVSRWLANDTWELLGGPLPPAEDCGPAEPASSSREKTKEVLTALPRALASGWAAAASIGGRDPSAWHWGLTHQAVRTHPLGDYLDASLLPPVPMGGDADTIHAGAYKWRQGDPFTAAGLSVYRQVINLADPSAASYVIPGGSSGNPRSPHFADQLSIWAECRRIPMLYPWPDIDAGGC
jgi:penicillin amidase